jgi:hypothetical protein
LCPHANKKLILSTGSTATAGRHQAQSEVGVSSLPPLSERIGLKNKNATDYTDSKSLADDAFELDRPGAEIEEQRQP